MAVLMEEKSPRKIASKRNGDVVTHSISRIFNIRGGASVIGESVDPK